MKRIVIALLAGASLLAAGCSSTSSNPSSGCTADTDCATDQVCQAGQCVAKAPADPCAPGCSAPTPICDKAAKTCVACLDNGNCSSADAPVCNPATKACVQCVDNTNCPTTGTPACDTTTNKCVVCTATAGCPADEECDTSVAGGHCKKRPDCVKNDDCTDGKVCDIDLGKCVTCTATDGCATDKVCDTSANGGACVDCLTTANCTGGKVCDTAAKACVTCTATEGCATDKVCDTSVAGGQCVGCTSDANCTAAGKVCDLATKTCQTCLTGDSHGCKPPMKYCVDSGSGPQCVACIADANCGTGKVCDTAVNQCVTCTASKGCKTGQTCDTTVADGVCTGCSTNADCTTGTNHVCDTAVTPHVCVLCRANADCGAAGNYCDPAGAGKCFECSSSVACAAAKPVCSNPAGGSCFVCTATAGCGGATPKCDTAAASGAGKCVQCVSNADCAEPNPVCGVNQTCGTGNGPAATSAQIAAVRAAADGTSLSLPIQGAVVTYLKPLLTQPATPEPAGFFVQAEQPGPAIFVAVDPATLTPPATVGDKVSFTVTALVTTSGMKQVSAITGYARSATGLSVTALVQDLSAANDVVSAVGTYESEIVKFTGTSGTWSTGGAGHQAAQLKTTGLPTEANLKLRVPQTLYNALEFVDGCAFTVTGPLWRYTTSAAVDQAEPCAYVQSDFSSISCPLPKVSSAASTAATTATVTFSRKIDPATLLANGSQFTIPGLAVSAAAASGNVVTLTTAAQTPGTAYTVTVANTVKDFLAVGVDAAQNTATFNGYALKVVSAVATSATAVNVTFDRAVLGTSVLANGSQFTFTGGLTASAAIVSATPTVVTVTTGNQTASTSYTVTVASTVTDATGVGLGTTNNSAPFTGFAGSVPCTPSVVISQAYGGGGSSVVTPFLNDFVELHNRTAAAVDVSTWSIQYASSTGSSWSVTPLTGSIAAGGYYLVQLGSNSAAGSTPLPTPDVTNGSVNLAQANGKVALVQSTTALTGSSPAASTYVDLVGYGTANYSEGTAVPALTNATAAIRNGNGCDDTNVNSADFTVGAPVPHNTASTPVPCTCH